MPARERQAGRLTYIWRQNSELRVGRSLFTFGYPARSGTSLHQRPPLLLPSLPHPFECKKIISFLLQKTSLQPYRLSCTRKDLRLREKKTETQRRNRTKHQVIISIKTGMIKIMICMKICFSFFFPQRLQLDLDALQKMSNNTYKCFSCNY